MFLVKHLDLALMEVFHHCFDHSALIRATGYIIALSHPLIIDHAQIDCIVEQIGPSLSTVS